MIRTIVSVVVLLLAIGSYSFGSNKKPLVIADIDHLANSYAQSVLEAIHRQESHNQYLISIGKAEEVNFIIDMRNYFNNPQHPELHSKPFVSQNVNKELNRQINAYYQSYRHPFYVILSPIYARADDKSLLRDLFNPDVFDFDEVEVWKTFYERYQVYIKKITEQKHSVFPATLEGRISDGAILDIESKIFYNLLAQEHQISFDAALILSNTVDKGDQIEDFYQQKLEANPAAFRIAYRHEPALQSYIQTVTDAFKTYYSPYQEPRNLSEQIAQNLNTLSFPVYVMVKTKGYYLLNADADRLYLDKWDQTFYELHLGTGGGRKYFNIDREGYVDATALQEEPQLANVAAAIPQLARTVRDVLISTKIILDIVRVAGGEYLENNRPITELLEADAQQGTLSSVDLIKKASQARTKLYNELQYSNYSGDELRARLLMLFDLTETLKKVFAPDSKYPFQQLTLAQIRVQAVTNSKVPPVDPEKSLLDYLEQRVAQGETLQGTEKEEYLRLLCKLKGDCRDGNQISQNAKDLVAYGRTLISTLNDEINNFRKITQVTRGVDARGKITGGTVASAKVEVANIEQIITDGSTASKGKVLNQYPNIMRYKSPQEITSTWNHAEQSVLGRAANEIDKVYADKSLVEGEIYLLVEQEVCSSCRQGLDNTNTSAGIVKQFSDEYPKITIIIYNLRKTNEVLIVRGGKRVQ